MQTSHASEPLQPKTWQLDPVENGDEGHLYYCLLCDEALALSKIQLDPERIAVAFDNKCPGCGFELDRVLSCKPSLLPSARRLLTSLKCIDAKVLAEKNPHQENRFRRARSLLSLQFPITTGVEEIDKTLVLKRGQLVFLLGEQSHALSILFCTRTALSPPRGREENVVFIDAGNLFDTTNISLDTTKLGLDKTQVQEKIHLSRAFTHHQVYSLIMENLPSDIDKYHPSLAVVSDMTALFCDPDAHDQKESLRLFRESANFLATIAGKKQILILATCTKSRNRKMERKLSETAHVSALLKGKGNYTQLKVTRHPSLIEEQQEAKLHRDTLPEYFR